MNPEWTRKFIELVKSGAPLKAYQKKLGLSKAELQYHLGRMAEYEATLEAPLVGREDVAKKVEKVKAIIEKVTERLDTEIVDFNEPEAEELELTTEEPEQEEVEEDDPEDEND